MIPLTRKIGSSTGPPGSPRRKKRAGLRSEGRLLEPFHESWAGGRLARDGSSRLLRRLTADRVLFDLGDPRAVAILRKDVARIARAMDRNGSTPPMLWTGIPFPARPPVATTGYCLVISVGGTKTDYAVMRLSRGQVHVLSGDGREVSGTEAAEAKKRLRFETPRRRAGDPPGPNMVELLCDRIGEYLAAHRRCLPHLRTALLSWGFAHKVVRTGPQVLGGLAAHSSEMTKDQQGFQKELAGKDLGALFEAELERRLGSSPRFTIANDGIMALHYFLTGKHLASYSRFGLFINGTGTNFAAAEPYAVRPEGVVSRRGEAYEPTRLTARRKLRPGESEEKFFINYETGSITLGATRTPFDVSRVYPIETNALSGGRAFPQGFREIVGRRISRALLERLVAAWRSANPEGGAPGGREVSEVAVEGPAAVSRVFAGARVTSSEAQDVCLACRAIVWRSAFHVALILAAVTRRTRFGLGDEAAGKRDLLAAEGSVWRTRGYSDLVLDAWTVLAGAPSLRVDIVHEAGYNASLPGPLHLAAIHEAPRRTRAKG